MEHTIRIAHQNAFAVVADHLRQLEYNHVLIVGSARSCRDTGIIEALRRHMPDIVIDQFGDFSPNPDFQEVWRGCRMLKKSGAAAVISLGGGTAMDIAKSMVGLHQLDEPAARNAIRNGGRDLSASTLSHIALPTTAGSGSEATHFAVVYLDGIKYSLASTHLMPTLSIIDGTLTRGMSRALAASSAMDALCQAIESYWAVAATKESMLYATRAIELLKHYMLPAINEQTSGAQNRIAEAACLAGQAINITKTTAAHAFSYYLTYQHGIPHGHAVSFCLPAVARVNYEAAEDFLTPGDLQARYQTLFQLTGVATLDEFIQWFKNLMRQIGLVTNPEMMGFDFDKEEQAFLRSVNLERLKNNPAPLDMKKFIQYFKENRHR
ncbi:phosphonoacetaldehyde reductase [Paremcibacter congregatus]|uniref:phosphonoacetaldehyde reductase n=1 Tax=Paremcibacter congregatus TaxID=2043170 RepID=UPI0030ECD040|tara:strand:- start:1235 stop:2374 length:1140 start_codon:yes stop_codon:yes gene_type:complete